MSRLLKTILLLSIFLSFELTSPNKLSSGNSKPPARDCLLGITPRFYNGDFYYETFNDIDQKVEKFKNYWGLKGVSIAIAKNGKLLYAKGYGLADAENQLNVEPYSRFRVASISKLVTAAAIMKLIEEQKLSLDAKVFGPNGILNNPSFGTPKDKRIYNISIRDLLHHSGGWRARYGDQLFMTDFIAKSLRIPKPLKLDDITRFVFTKSLHFTPGTRSSYSNYGYALLGQVIEKVTNLPYEEYVNTTILKPLGITSMSIGRSTRDSSLTDEVAYYEVPEAKKITPYNAMTGQVSKSNGGNDIQLLGAAGGWVSSSVDLIKLALALDGDNNVPDLLDRKMIDTMVVRPKGFLPIGWIRATDDGRFVRTGNFAGTSTILVKEPNGVCWVFLTNTSPWCGSKFHRKINVFMHGVLNSIPEFADDNATQGKVEEELEDEEFSLN